MAASAVFNAREVLEALVEASGHGPGKTALDVACGPGIVTEALAARGGLVCALDLTPEMIRLARLRCDQAGLRNVECTVGRAESLPFPPQHFDSVVARFAIHHMEDPASAIAQMCRVLKDGGRIVLVDAISSEDADERQLHNALESLRDPSHTRMLSPSELSLLAESGGLTVLGRRFWQQPREFGEWMGIVNAPDREGPLRTIMECLVKAGFQAGIGLHAQGGVLTFTHRLMMLTAEKPPGPIPPG
jgi:ubiquinone/menaquinone biosynthesis C-methylase UbiE